MLGLDEFIEVDGSTATPSPDGGAPPDPGDPATEGGTPNEGGTLTPAGRCAGRAGPRPVPIDGFCIDATEVSNADYAAFLDARGADTSGQPPFCSWNSTFVPTRDWPFLANEAQLPVHSVDWCDAWAYCAWAGKRLCGRRGGGTLSPSARTRPGQSEWMYACTKNGIQSYPYGDTYRSNACTTEANGYTAVGSVPTCEGAFPGVFDMIGNAHEWEDSCETATGDAGDGRNDSCAMRGEDYYQSANKDCRYLEVQSRSTAFVSVGIRCCSTLTP
jgi:formylglycine-generating enzyme required for sulfatase activity